MATSSAIKLGDLGLVWSNVTGDADAVIIDNDLGSDLGLLTAVLLSLYCDRRAEDDDVPPSGDPNDRRGWWADELLYVPGDRIGSRLWLLDRAKNTNENRLKAKEYAREALAWFVEDKVVESVDITSTAISNFGILIEGALNRPGKDPVAFRFAHTWDNLQGDV